MGLQPPVDPRLTDFICKVRLGGSLSVRGSCALEGMRENILASTKYYENTHQLGWIECLEVVDVSRFG